MTRTEAVVVALVAVLFVGFVIAGARQHARTERVTSCLALRSELLRERCLDALHPKVER